MKRLLSVFLVLAGIAVLLVAVGAIYQSVSVRREARRFPPPGTLVDVGGRRLHLHCTGDGSPIVLFESSGLGNSTSFDAVRADLAGRTRTCAYDRMGTGWSDAGPSDISAGVLADDLERVIDRAGLRPPFLLVPASIGGLTVELFARRHRDKVAGLVFVDAADSGMAEQVAPRLESLGMQLRLLCLAGPVARIGVWRVLDPLGLRHQPGDAAARTIALTYRAEPLNTVCSILRGAQASVAELRQAPPLAPDVPLIVLTHSWPFGILPPGYEDVEAAYEPEWRDLQQRLSRRSTRGVWRVVPESGHLIAGSQPHAVAAAVSEMLDRVAQR
jgi:pimeloyl-ACP methyl ester carboxylesterase